MAAEDYEKHKAECTPDDALTAYGRAMAKVQALEQLMRLALGEEEVRKALRKGEDRLDPNLGAAMLNYDFGKLEQRICGKFSAASPRRARRAMHPRLVDHTGTQPRTNPYVGRLPCRNRHSV